MKELTGLDPMISEDRERLSLGLKAYGSCDALPRAERETICAEMCSPGARRVYNRAQAGRS